jgi:hypothetical protein
MTLYETLSALPAVSVDEKLYVQENRLYIGTSVRPIRTFFNMLQNGYCRRDVIDYILYVSGLIILYTDDVEKHILNTYVLKNFSIYNIIPTEVKSKITDIKLLLPLLKKLMTSVCNIKTTYGSDPVACEKLMDIHKQVEKGFHVLSRITETFVPTKHTFNMYKEMMYTQ